MPLAFVVDISVSVVLHMFVLLQKSYSGNIIDAFSLIGLRRLCFLHIVLSAVIAVLLGIHIVVHSCASALSRITIITDVKSQSFCCEMLSLLLALALDECCVCSLSDASCQWHSNGACRYTKIFFNPQYTFTQFFAYFKQRWCYRLLKYSDQ